MSAAKRSYGKRRLSGGEDEPPAKRRARNERDSGRAQEDGEAQSSAKRRREAAEEAGRRSGPSHKQLRKLQAALQELQVPVLSVGEADALLGNDPQRLGAGSYGEAFLNAKDNVVVKYSFGFNEYLSSVSEVKAMAALKDVRGVQKLVGVCPERFMIATRYGGPILHSWLAKDSPLLPKHWIDIAAEIARIFSEIHSLGFVHNDIKTNNLCLEVTPDGLEVTVIDFGLAEKRGKRLHLSGGWDEVDCYPPEFFKKRGGRCRARSDVYGIGKILRKIFRRARPETPALATWLERSQRMKPTTRPKLDLLLELLEEEKKKRMWRRLLR